MTTLDMDAVIEMRRQHAPRRRWWSRRIRCQACGLAFPCPKQVFAQARIRQLLAEVLEANRGRHW